MAFRQLGLGLFHKKSYEKSMAHVESGAVFNP